MREKLIELLVKADYAACKTIQNRDDNDVRTVWQVLADHLIANGVTFATDNNVGDKSTPTDKDTNVPSKPIPHKVENEPIRVGAGLWCKGTTVYKCPKCQTFVMRYCKFCFECGQALEWQTEPPKGE